MLPLGQLYYYNTPILLCQAFFRTFFEFSSKILTLPLYYDKMPSDLKGYIEEVTKYTVESYNSSAIIETPGKLWLLSRREVAGSTYAQEGTLYPIFSDDASRVKYNINGKPNRWFLRSPSSQSSGDMMGVVQSYGSVGGRYATSAYPDPICFCFCV